jgi:hypothetical protein
VRVPEGSGGRAEMKIKLELEEADIAKFDGITEDAESTVVELVELIELVDVEELEISVMDGERSVGVRTIVGDVGAANHVVEVVLEPAAG